MKRIIVLLALFATMPAIAATLSWEAPTTYVTGDPIASYEFSIMTYQTFNGPSSTGPWLSDTITVAGQTSANVKEPAPGQTIWYTVSAHILNNSSEKAAAVSKATPFPPIRPPEGVVVR